MRIGSIKLNEDTLQFAIIKNYFKDTSGILKVSKKINGENVIDYDYLKSKMPSVSERPNIYGLYIKEENKKLNILVKGNIKEF